jgi:hypothetical protein
MAVIWLDYGAWHPWQSCNHRPISTGHNLIGRHSLSPLVSQKAAIWLGYGPWQPLAEL